MRRVDVTSPLTTTVASGRWTSEPAPGGEEQRDQAEARDERGHEHGPEPHQLATSCHERGHDVLGRLSLRVLGRFHQRLDVLPGHGSHHLGGPVVVRLAVEDWLVWRSGLPGRGVKQFGLEGPHRRPRRVP